ncbi:MAG: hypothetical protein KatS3mg115_0893 [Candidatus Poribacteria bacterium]|nr:MAG: hypothetical protein KatS3mg115_0893 [Candidatus Poribacteria bacterium]
MDRAKRNGGILPDNVGPNGIIGERMNGKWWGGYYGWRWPHGARNILEATLIAGQNALLLTGDRGYLDLHRSQWDRLCSLGREENGRWVIPYRHGDRGWFDYRPPDPYFPIHLYATSWEQQDWQRLEALGHRDDWVQRARFGKGGQFYPSAWFALVHDRREEAVERMLDATEEEVNRRLSLIQADADEDPETWDVHHWQDRNPVVCEPLVQLAMGTPGAIYHGGLLHASLRFFDEERGRAGLPEGVAARVREITADRVQLELINADLLRSKRMILQAGTFGEHRFQTIGDQSVNARRLRLILEPGAIGTISLGIARFVGSPSYGYALTPQSS